MRKMITMTVANLFLSQPVKSDNVNAPNAEKLIFSKITDWKWQFWIWPAVFVQGMKSTFKISIFILFHFVRTVKLKSFHSLKSSSYIAYFILEEGKHYGACLCSSVKNTVSGKQQTKAYLYFIRLKRNMLKTANKLVFTEDKQIFFGSISLRISTLQNMVVDDKVVILHANIPI